MKVEAKELLRMISEYSDIVDTTVMGILFVKDVQLPIRFSNTTFENQCYFEKLSGEDLLFDNCNFKSTINLGDIRCKTLDFNSCTFDKSFRLSNSAIDSVSISESYFLEYSSIDYLVSDYLALHKISSQEIPFRIFSPQTGNLNIYFPKANSDIEIKKKIPEDVTSTPFIKNLGCNLNLDFNGKILLNELLIEFSYYNGNSNGTITLNSLTAHEILVSNFENYGKINLSSLLNVNDKSTIKLENSNLGVINLYDIDFYLFDVIIENSNIQDIIPANVKWCDYVETEVNRDIDTDLISDPADLKEVYRQLKNVMIKSNNRPEELRFHSLEMTNYRIQLKDDKEHKLDRIILLLNKISNNHGLDPVKALGWLFAFSITFYAINQTLLGNYIQITVTSTFKSIQDVLELINPVRKFTDVYSTTLNSSNWQFSLAKIFDNIFKVISSYLIFQFITAFRKFVRK